MALSVKPIKYFIDSHFRDHVTPVPGSVVYCDLWLGAEHSGIYVGDGKISNIVVDGFASATVELDTPRSFTSKSILGRKIYVSCKKKEAAGHPRIAYGAQSHVGERSFYGLVIKNCHSFSTKCVTYIDKENSDEYQENKISELNLDEYDSWEPTLQILKKTAKAKLGANSWRLWDWDGSIAANPPPEPDWQALRDELSRQPLTPENIEEIRKASSELQAYEAEISAENIPQDIRKNLRVHIQLLADIDAKYEKAKQFLLSCPGAGFSYADLTASKENFTALAQTLQRSAAIKELAQKMGRAYISEHRKKQTRIPQASRSEVHGTHRSDDVMRLLPSELLNLEDETLENLFYARLLEKQLQTYELQGTTHVQGETTEAQRKRTGPVVACLDTSGSMSGEPLLKAKALLLAIANILRAEQRSLHVVLFGSAGQTREFALEDASGVPGLLRFLSQGFGGGTDFETPLKRALKIIAEQPAYEKADVLMISDGDCQVPATFIQHLQERKAALDCMVYSVLCNGKRVEDAFSDEVIVL